MSQPQDMRERTPEPVEALLHGLLNWNLLYTNKEQAMRNVLPQIQRMIDTERSDRESAEKKLAIETETVIIMQTKLLKEQKEISELRAIIEHQQCQWCCEGEHDKFESQLSHQKSVIIKLREALEQIAAPVMAGHKLDELYQQIAKEALTEPSEGKK